MANGSHLHHRNRRKLGDVYEEVMGKKIEGAHRSLNDVEATIEIIKWYKKMGHME